MEDFSRTISFLCSGPIVSLARPGAVILFFPVDLQEGFFFKIRTVQF